MRIITRDPPNVESTVAAAASDGDTNVYYRTKYLSAISDVPLVPTKYNIVSHDT